jgi:hypothetical protein
MTSESIIQGDSRVRCAVLLTRSEISGAAWRAVGMQREAAHEPHCSDSIPKSAYGDRGGQAVTGTASVTFSGSVEMVAKSEIPNTPETAQIALEAGRQQSNIITIENTLTDKSAHEVHLSPGDKVEVTVDAKAGAIQPTRCNSGPSEEMPNRRFRLIRMSYPLSGICEDCQKTFLSRTEDAAQAEKELSASFHEHLCQTQNHEHDATIDDTLITAKRNSPPWSLGVSASWLTWSHGGSLRVSSSFGTIASRLARSRSVSPERLAEIQSHGTEVGITGMRERVRHFRGDLDRQTSRNSTPFPITSVIVAPLLGHYRRQL